MHQDIIGDDRWRQDSIVFQDEEDVFAGSNTEVELNSTAGLSFTSNVPTPVDMIDASVTVTGVETVTVVYRNETGVIKEEIVSDLTVLHKIHQALFRWNDLYRNDVC